MKTIFIFLFLFFIGIFACKQSETLKQETSTETTNTPHKVATPGMVKVTVMYPGGEGKTFDMDYYKKNHMPLMQKLFGESMKFYTIDKGLKSGMPDTPLPYEVIGILYFDNIAGYDAGMKAHTDEIRDDIAKYTNIVPVVQICEVVE
jgi:uncharacterized protein (TIGR02118 family)